MKIYVCIKPVPDTETRIKLLPDGSGVDLTGVKWMTSPYDEYAVEEAIKTKALRPEATVVVVTVAPKGPSTEACLRNALALGADEAIHISCDQTLSAPVAAKLVAHKIAADGPYHAIFTGTLGIDLNQGAFGTALACALNIPSVSNVVAFGQGTGSGHGLAGNNGADGTGDISAILQPGFSEGFWAEKEGSGGTRSQFSVKGPFVITANKGLNTPRFPTVPNILKAKKKPLSEVAATDLAKSLGVDLDLDSNQALPKSGTKYKFPAERAPVTMIQGDLPNQCKELAITLSPMIRSLNTQ